MNTDRTNSIYLPIGTQFAGSTKGSDLWRKLRQWNCTYEGADLPMDITHRCMKKVGLTFIFALALVNLSAQDFRSVDGSGNNLQNTQWGSSGAELVSIVSNGFADQISSVDGQDRPNPRVLSNALFSQSGKINDQLNLSDYVWVFGQFIDHDITLVENNPAEPLLIPVPADDPIFDPFATGSVVIPMLRSMPHPGTGTSTANPRNYSNAITSFIDASAVYGSDEYRANYLRSFSGGKLRMINYSGMELLPFNTITGFFNDPTDPEAPFMADDTHSGSKLFMAGDVRANENLLLLSFHTLFAREHNRLCDLLMEQHPEYGDEDLYQHARKIVGGLLQAITFEEWLPAMGVHLSTYAGYRPAVDPGIMNVFSAAAFRLGHTLLSGEIVRMNNNGEEIPQGNTTLREAFFNPKEILRAGGVDPYFKGMGVQIQQELDCKMVDDVRNFLFGPPGAGGLDLAAINIMRGRERGLPDFNTIREDLGLGRVSDFVEICSNPDLNMDLAELYGTVDDVDPWVGMLAEDHMPEALFGETIMKIMELQFQNLRDGDRYYYENDEFLSAEEKEEIRSTKLSDIIRRNTSITLMQDDVFHAMEHSNIPFANVYVTKRALDIALFPNPVGEYAHFKVYALEDGPARATFFDMSGRTVHSLTTNFEEGENRLSVPLENRISAGIYFVEMTMGNASNTVKLIKR